MEADGQRVELVRPFRTAVSNSLLDGVVRVRRGTEMQLMEINAVCSMPALPGWPAYDNVYGRPVAQPEDAKGSTGQTAWQVLFHFNRPQETRMGSLPGPWLGRLRENLCRRGDFSDRKG